MAVYDAVIIGAGLGGLLCGHMLSKEGLNVCVIDKNHKPGGSLQTFGRKGCIFNTGLNYTESLDDGQVLNKYFRYFGFIGKLKLRKLDEKGFEIIDFNDGQYAFAMGRERFIETLSAQFPADRKGIREYMDMIREICNNISMYSFSETPTNMIDNRYLHIGAADYIRSVITNPRLQNILAGNGMLYSGNESKTPLHIHALINNSFIDSAWRIADGSHQLVNILTGNIVSGGGTIILKQLVEKLVTEDGKVSHAILSNGEKIYGKNFIANIHPAQVLKMVNPGSFRKSYYTRIDSLEDTMGMFTVYLVFKKNSFPYYNSNFYHYNQDSVWVASGYDHSKWPQNYLFMPTSMSGGEEFAQSGSIITYMDYKELTRWENTFTGNRGDDYLEFKQKKAEQLLDAVQKQFPGLRNHIETYYTSTPLTWRDYTGTRAGSAYGIQKDYHRPIESLILPRTHVPNLFLTGQNNAVHGILGVTISAVVTCSELIDGNYLMSKIKSS
jgi:all-trans-retinol 13,14-reductase